MRHRQRRLAIGLFVTILLIAVSLPLLQSWLMNHGYHGRWLDEPAPDFKLKTETGDTLGLHDFPNETLFVYFGYLHCDGFCQNQWVTLFHVVQQLQEKPIRVILITLDPTRDSEADMALLAANLGPQFVAIRGSNAADIQRVANAYHAPYIKQGDWKASDYLIDHSGEIFMIMPDKRIKLVYAGSVPSALIVQDYRQLNNK